MFQLRPEGTFFQVSSVATPYVADDWGKDTIGLLQENDAASLLECELDTLGLHEALSMLSRKFDLKLERRFPKIRSGGGCVMSRIGRRI